MLEKVERWSPAPNPKTIAGMPTTAANRSSGIRRVVSLDTSAVLAASSLTSKAEERTKGLPVLLPEMARTNAALILSVSTSTPDWSGLGLRMKGGTPKFLAYLAAYLM